MNLNFMRLHEISLRQDIKSNYRHTAGLISLNLFINTKFAKLELPKRPKISNGYQITKVKDKAKKEYYRGTTVEYFWNPALQ